jgi:hypothetical protein
MRSTIGPIVRQAVHQGAEKKSRTGRGERVIASRVASVTCVVPMHPA